MIGLGIDIPGLRALGRLGAATDTLSRVSERLASGQRINHASDDAAGLAIASGLNSKARIYTQSMRNLNDAVSALSIADSAAGELSNVLARLQELAEQAANGTYSTAQRAALNNEAQKLRDEFNRQVSTTSFNGTRLLDQNTGRIRLEAGNTSSSAALYIDPSNLAVGAKGQGSFGSAVTSNVGVSGYEVQSKDFDGDGILDLVRDDAVSNGISIQIGNGDGTFRSSKAVAGSAQFGSVSRIRCFDFNNDGITDIATAGDEVAIYFGNGDGSFKSGSKISGLAGVEAIEFADWDRDGKLDLISGNGTNIEVRLGNSNGTFGAAVATLNLGFTATSLGVGDLDNDGLIDVALGNSSNGQIDVAFNDGSGGFTGPQALTGSNGALTADVVLADVNGDNRLDVLASKFDVAIGVYLNTSHQTFAAETSYGTGGGRIVVADFNADGKLDMASSGNSGSPTFVLNNGNGTFGTQTSFGFISNSFGLVVGDFNGDGVDDVSAADVNSNNQFTALATPSATSYLNAITLTSRSGALSAMRTLSSAQTALGTARGRIGADQSRLASALNTVTTTRENFLAAAGRIQDADIASESALLARSKILQQSAAQILAQSAQQPQLVLALLRI